MISRWPIRTGVLVDRNTAYFGAGVFPHETIYLCAVDARDGTLVWYFDVVTGATCRPDPGDDLRRFDGYHDAAELGLPDDFFTTREGCDFDRFGVRCGSVWPVPCALEFTK